MYMAVFVLGVGLEKIRGLETFILFIGRKLVF